MIKTSSPLARKENNEMLEKLKFFEKKGDNDKNDQKKENKPDNVSKEEEKKEDEKKEGEGRRGSEKDAKAGDDDEVLQNTSVKEFAIFKKFFGNYDEPRFTSYNPHYNTEDYTWKIQGSAFMSEISPELADYISELNEYIMRMTLGKFGEANVDTEPLRQSVIYYIERIYGYEHPDFEYKQVNVLLKKEFKTAIRAAAVMPYTVTYQIMNKVPVEFPSHERVHLALLIMAAKFQIGLMYAYLTQGTISC